MNPAYLAHLTREIEQLKEAGLYKTERVITSPQQPQMKANGRDVVCLCANNYLGLANHPEVIAAGKAVMDGHGFGMASVRFICGTQDIHRELEQKLAAFLGFEDTQLYSSCFDANGAIFEGLLGEEDARAGHLPRAHDAGAAPDLRLVQKRPGLLHDPPLDGEIALGGIKVPVEHLGVGAHRVSRVVAPCLEVVRFDPSYEKVVRFLLGDALVDGELWIAVGEHAFRGLSEKAARPRPQGNGRESQPEGRPTADGADAWHVDLSFSRGRGTASTLPRGRHRRNGADCRGAIRRSERRRNPGGCRVWARMREAQSGRRGQPFTRNMRAGPTSPVPAGSASRNPRPRMRLNGPAGSVRAERSRKAASSRSRRPSA